MVLCVSSTRQSGAVCAESAAFAVLQRDCKEKDTFRISALRGYDSWFVISGGELFHDSQH